MGAFVVLFLLCGMLSAVEPHSSRYTEVQVLNNTPTIGILTQEISHFLNKKFPNQYHSYIAASYVKFVEGAGAKVAPICETKPTCWLRKVDEELNENYSPIIGILSQEIVSFPGYQIDNNNKAYIAASYSKFVEGGGARTAPIWIGKPREYYLNLMSKINGVLFPGGSTYFNQSVGYAEAGAHIYDIAKEMNERGKYMPIWGTCLGFELLTYLSANNTEHRSNCRSSSQPLPLEFKSGFNTSRLFGSAPEDVIEILSNEYVTPNFHQFCVTEQNLTKLGLKKEWKVLSVNHDWDGLEFISSIEHKKYPFYGVQFHPEKNIYEWVKNKNITHTANAIKSAQYFAEFFVNEARKSSNRFANKTEEFNSLIYNYSPTFTAKQGSSFWQAYLFPEDVTSESGSMSYRAIFNTKIMLHIFCYLALYNFCMLLNSSSLNS